MGGLSWIHWLLIAAVVLVLFGGKGKISDLMGDFGRGVNSFKKGLNEGHKDDPKVINGERSETAANPTKDSVQQ